MGWGNPIVAGEELVISGIRSEDYVESTTGWRISKDGKAQFANLSSLGDFGATGDISADSFHVGPGGLWLPDDTELIPRLEALEELSSKPRTVAFFGDRASGTFTGATEVAIGEVQWNDPIGGFLCVIAQAGFTVDANPAAVCIRIRYTSDGSTPTTSSTLLQNGPPFHVGATGTTYGAMILYSEFFGPDIPHRMLVTLARTAGSGNVTPSFSSNLRTQIVAFRINDTDVTSGMINSGGGSAPPPTPKTYTKTYQPTWSRTYDGDNSTTFDDSASCYQGYYSGDRGNTRSLVGYNYTQIQSDLSGATVNSTKLTFKVQHAYYNAGVDVLVGKHDYTSKPSTWDGSRVDERQYTRNNCVAGSTYTVTLPSAFGTEFKSGVTKGIAFGPAANNDRDFYGYLYGATQTGKPYLTITYTK